MSLWGKHGLRAFVLQLTFCLTFGLSANSASMGVRWPKSSDSWSRASDYTYILVAGFLNESLPGYFDDNVKALLDLDIPQNAIHVIEPSSSKDFDQNSKDLNTKLRSIIKSKTKPVVIIAHSKGAVEVLKWVSENQSYADSKVSNIYLVQGAFGGTPISDYILGEGHPVDSKMPVLDAAEFVASIALQKILKLLFFDGFKAVSTPNAKNVSQELVENFSTIKRSLDNKIHFITSSESKKRVSHIIRPGAAYLSTYYGKNDGLILERDQIIEGLGDLLLHLKCDHLDTAFTSTMSDSDYGFRSDFMKSIVWHNVNRELPF